MGVNRQDLDWTTGIMAISAGVILGALVAPWAMDFGRDDGRWWLTVVILAAAVVTLRVVASGIIRLRRQRAADDSRAQRPTE